MSKFSFGKVFLGLTCGVTLPFVVHEDVYYAIAVSFLSPHLKYWKNASQRDKQKALPVEALDAYMIDVTKSFLMFWIIIGPAIYQSYYRKANIFENSGQTILDNKISERPDTFATLATKMKQMEQVTAKAEDTPAGDALGSEDQEGRVTFADYERLMQRLEKEKNWEEIQNQNPRARFYARREREEIIS